MTNAVSWHQPLLPQDASAVPVDRLAAMSAHVPSADGICGGQLPAELIAHVVVALSRYRRQLRAEGARVPGQLEDLVAFLADRVKAHRDVLMLDPWHAVSSPSAMPRRLLIAKSEAAEQLGVSLRTIERLISSGRLPLVHVEGAARVRVSDLEAYVEALEGDGGPKPVT